MDFQVKSHLGHIKQQQILAISLCGGVAAQGNSISENLCISLGEEVIEKNYLLLKILVIEMAEKILHLENLNLYATIKNKISEEECSRAHEKASWQTPLGPRAACKECWL